MNSRIYRRISAIILALAVAMSFAPGYALEAFAEENAQENVQTEASEQQLDSQEQANDGQTGTDEINAGEQNGTEAEQALQAAAEEAETTELSEYQIPSWYDDNKHSFVIRDENQLRELAELVNNGYSMSDKEIYLANDIKLTGGEWTPIGIDSGDGEISNVFSGSFDGRGHTISGIRISEDAFDHRRDGAFYKYRYTGLFGHNAGTIKNLSVKGEINESWFTGGVAGENTGSVENVKSYVNYFTTDSISDYFGGVVGCNMGTIDGCYYEGEIETRAGNAGGICEDNRNIVRNSCSKAVINVADANNYEVSAGGIAAEIYGNPSSVVENCYSLSTIYADGCDATGGIVGELYCNSSVKNCYFAGHVGGAEENNAIVGKIYSSDSTVLTASSNYSLRGSCENTSKDTNLTGIIVGKSQLSSAEVLASLGEEFAADIWGDNDSYPYLKWQLNGIGKEMPDWYINGKANKSATLKVYEELAEFQSILNYGIDDFEGWTISLAGDIAISPAWDVDYEHYGWDEIGTEAHPFRGCFDGKGYQISGLMIKSEEYPETESYVPTKYKALFGVNEGTIKNLTVSGNSKYNSYHTVDFVRTYSAGVVGLNKGTVENVKNEVTLTCASDVGFFGGVCARNEGTVKNCINQAALESAQAYTLGGVVGTNCGVVTGCSNKGDITVKSGEEYQYIGGIVGSSYDTDHEEYSTIKACYNAAAVSVDGGYAGGIIGTIGGPDDIISECYSYGAISAGYGKNAIAGKQAFGSKYNYDCNYALDSSCDNSDTKEMYTGKLVSAATLKTQSLLSRLGSAYVRDYTEINSGYPVLRWELDYEAAPVLQVEDLIAEIGAVSYDSGNAIEKARAAYNELSAAQKKQVTRYASLVRAEASYKKICDVCDAIEALSAIETLTLNDRPLVVKARTAFDSLSDAQQEEVYNYSVLEMAEDDMSALVAGANPVAVSKYTLTAGKGKITVKWTEVTGATHYIIYRSTKKSSGYKAVATVKAGKKSYVNTKLAVGKKYYYKIKAYNYCAGYKYYSKYSAVKYAKVK